MSDAAARRMLLPVLLGGQVLVNVDLTVVNVAAPAIRAELGATGGQVTLVLAGYTLAYAVLLVPGARLGGSHGERRAFRVGLVVFTLASAVCGSAPTATALVAARLVQGAGAALVVPQVLGVIHLLFGGPRRARALGLYGIALAAGAVLGQVLGGLLVSVDVLGTGWRSVFLVNVPVGAVLVAASARCLPADGPRRVRPADLPGALALCATMLAALLPLVLGRDLGWPWWTGVSLAASVPAALLFVQRERRRERRGYEPLFPGAVFSHPPVRWGLVAHGASTAVCLSLLFVASLYLQTGLGHSPGRTSLALLAVLIAFGVAGPLHARLPPRPAGAVPVVSCVLLALACAALASLTAVGVPATGSLIVLLGAAGLGLGASSVSLIGAITAAASAEHAADTSGAINANAQLWGAAGTAVLGTLYFALALPGDPGSAGRAVALAFVVSTLLAAGAALAAVACVRSGRAAAPASGDTGRRP